MSQNKDSSDKNRKQKNLRLGQEYHSQLENLAEEWYNSRKKQGHVVEDLLDMVGDSSLESEQMRLIREIHSEVVGQSGGVSSTHTGNSVSSQSSHDEDEEVEEIVELAEAGEPIDPDEYDLSKLKNKTVDWVSIVTSVFSHTHGVENYSKNDVREFFEQKADYQYNGANQKANKVMTEVYTPLEGLDEKVEEWVEEEIQSGSKMVEMNNKTTYRQKYKSVEGYTDCDFIDDVNAGHHDAEVATAKVRPLISTNIERIERGDNVRHAVNVLDFVLEKVEGTEMQEHVDFDEAMEALESAVN